MDKGDKFLGVPFYSNNSISVEGKGTVLLEPAEFNKISLQDDKFILDNESGIFQAGMEIEPGNYELHVEGNMPFYVFVGVNNYDENSKNPKSFDIKDTSNEIKFTLKDEDILKIFNWSNNKTDFTVNLIKKED
ncbi:hypothetical protein [Neobacillus drentensis]|uniref:hypothetical protein n=1 Tax=Neobacillus drentensis TaxID=220684 RepID=UPI002FFE238C